MSHSISVNEASSMTARYRTDKTKILDAQYQNTNVLCKCESFDSNTIQAILDISGCVGFRIYYGMDEDLNVHAILVGVNEEDEDILPEDHEEATGYLAERSLRCPTICPPNSPLNS